MLRAAGILLAGGLAASVCARARDLPAISAYAAVATEYVEHGLSRSQGEAIVKARLSVASESGWSAAVAASTLNLNPGRGPAHEFDFYLAKVIELQPDWSIAATLVSYDFGPNSPAASYDYNEASVSVGWRETLEFGVQYSPDYTSFSRYGLWRRQDAWNFAGSLRYPLRPGLELGAGLGYRDLQGGVGLRYWYWSAGGVLSHGRVSLALSYINSDATARASFRSAASDLCVATLGFRIH
jgi:uncharacterized protein (TIGR02001 family)